jgi:hypothetical protein
MFRERVADVEGLSDEAATQLAAAIQRVAREVPEGHFWPTT